MARPKRERQPRSAASLRLPGLPDARSDVDARGVAVDIDALARPRFSRDLLPVFMMIESEVFQRLNEKAATRRVGYDMLLRTILHDHLGRYLKIAARHDQDPHQSAPRRRR